VAPASPAFDWPLHRVAAGLVLLLSLAVGTHWHLQTELVAQWLPGVDRLGIVNPTLFLVAGLLLCDVQLPLAPARRAPWRRWAAGAGVALLLLLPAGHLLEALSGTSFGIDFTFRPSQATDENPHPGRLSPNASIAFLVTGLAFWVLQRPMGTARQRVLLACTCCIGLIGYAGLAGHFVGLERLYRVPDFNRIRPATAFGFLVLSVGLWAVHEATLPYAIEQARRRIARRTLAVCTLVAISAGVAGFAVMRITFEETLSRNMLLTATTNATSLQHAIEVGLEATEALAQRPQVARALAAFGARPGDAAPTAVLGELAANTLGGELTHVRFDGTGPRLAATAGATSRERADIRLPLRHAASSAELAYDGGYLLLARASVLSGGVVVGSVTTEHRLPLFEKVLQALRHAEATSDAVICGGVDGKALCAATRFRTPSFALALEHTAGQASDAVARALRGERGVLRAKDPRGIAVLAAYTPIDRFGLGLGVKTDVDTLYAPLRARFAELAAVLALIIALAIFMLRSQVQPLLGRLAQTERRMSGILEEQSELVSLARPDGELVYVNPAYARHFGLTPEAMTGMNLLDHVAPADRDAVRANIAAVLRSGTPQTQENRMATAADGARWVSWQNHVQHDAQGQPLLHSVGRDITERKAAEQALQASQAILARTGRLAAIGGWELDLATQALQWTDETRRIHEVPADYQPALDTALRFYAPQAQAQIEAAVQACTAEGTPWDLELQMTTALGRPIWVRAQGKLERELGQPVRLVGAFQDITARKLLEQRLEANERFIRQVTDQVPVRISYTDAQGRYRFVNMAHCHRFGLPREQIIGRRRSELVAGPGNAVVDHAVAEVLQGRAQRFEFDELVQGRVVRIESRMLPDTGEDGTVRGFYSIGIDITERSAAERALRDLATIFDNTTDYVVQADARGQIVYMNPAVRAAVGIPAGAPLASHHFNDFNTPETQARYAQVIVPAVKAHGVWIGQTTVIVADGRVVPVNHMVIAQRDAEGRLERFSAIMRDISADVAAQQERDRQAATLRSVAEAIPAIVAVVDRHGRYRFANSAFERWAGTSRQGIVGRPLKDVLGKTEHERSRPFIERVLAGETVHFEKAYAARNPPQHLAISYVPLWLENGEIDGFVGVAQDITRHKLEEGRLIQLSQRDALTGLLNRSGFEQVLQAIGSDGASIATTALMYIDLDHFKPVNDTHGHPVGDALLRQFAQRLTASVRPSDAVARLGGDEFAIALTRVRDAASAQAVAQKIVAAAQAPFQVQGLTLQVSASVGVAMGTATEEGWSALVARADAMLYRAKAGGRGRYVAAD
jgi:diguanylate cyclase (GGDEF)-like protein/PAS domain S-box-containing protein